MGVMRNIDSTSLFSSPAELQNGRSAFVFLLAVYSLTFVFEGPLRYVLSQGGFSSFIYLRDVIPLYFCVALLYRWGRGDVQPNLFLIVVLLLAIHFWIGYFFLSGVFQRLFGLKVFMALLLGITAGCLLSIRDDRLFRPLLFVFLISACGVFLNHFITFKWEGADYETFLGLVKQTRDWTAGGIRRLAGFARSSFDVASVLLVLAVFLVCTSKSRLASVAIYLTATLAIALTTSKGALLALLVFGGVHVVGSWTSRLTLLRSALTLVVLILCIFPLLSILIEVSTRDLPEGLRFAFSSFVERMRWMWPSAIDNLTDHGSLITGRGLGGIGVAQRFGEFEISNAADNFFVYLLVTFGVWGGVYFFYIFLGAMFWRSQSQERRDEYTVISLLLALMVYGLTLNLIEQPILAMVLGLCIVRFDGCVLAGKE